MIPLRDENPTRITPYVTWLFLALNIIVFVMQSTGGMYEAGNRLGGPMAGWTLVPAEITSGRDYFINGPTLQPMWLTLFTSMFMHGGLMHLIGNMLFLVIFGNNIEDVLGHVKYFFFYVLCGLAASAAQIAYAPGSIIPNLGASGAIAGVLGAYLLLYPKARVNSLIFLGFFITTVRLPAWLLLGFWIVSQFFSHYTQSLKTDVMGGETGGVAYLAHIGGFLAGMLLVKLMGAKNPEDPYGDGSYGYGAYGDSYTGRRGPVYRVVPPRGNDRRF